MHEDVATFALGRMRPAARAPKGKVNASRQVPVLIPIDSWTDIGKASPDLTRPSEKDRDDA